MSSTQQIRLYNLLLKKGFAAEEAEAFVAEVLTRDEAKEVLATKHDLVELERMMTRSTFVAIGIILTGIAVLLQLFVG